MNCYGDKARGSDLGQTFGLFQVGDGGAAAGKVSGSMGVKRLAMLAALIVVFFSRAAFGAVVPQPAKMESRPGNFVLPDDISIVYSDAAARPEAEMLAEFLRPATGFQIPVKQSSSAGAAGLSIIMQLDAVQESKLGKEGYVLDITPANLRITAAAPAGLFYGGQTLRQLLPPVVFAKTKQTGVKWEVQCCRIEDQPRFGWRGFMLDSSRHFIAAESIRDWIDWLAMHKLNVMHWHLVDDHGWRFESKKYPLLTQVGAWREQPPIGRYGGFYTRKELREMVAYAASRHVTIVPEIEMPGHSRAALAAYPSLACGGTKTEVDHFFKFPMAETKFPPIPGNNVFCAGREKTYEFLENILNEVMDIFPDTYIHVGGDEVNLKYWNDCTDCRSMMKANGLSDGKKLQAYLMGRMEKVLNKRGRRLIGWDDIIEGGLSGSATVMSWRGPAGGIHAARTGHDAVMSPEKPLYFDHRQSGSPLHPPGFGARIEMLQEVYAYDPVPKALSADEGRHILGAQANLWTCATETDERLQLFAFPRFCALAEIAWCEPTAKNYELFLKRLDEHLRRLDVLGINYWIEPADIQIGTWSPNPVLKGGTSLEVPVSQSLRPGQWTVTFNYQKGADALTIDSVELLANGVVIAADAHAGTAGSQRIRNKYSLVIPEAAVSSRHVLRAKVHVTPWSGGGNGDSTGTITMSRAAPVCLFAPERPLPVIPATTPVAQGGAWWSDRHKLVLDRNKILKPEIVVIGDSITHCWGGEPKSVYEARGAESWKSAFGNRPASNLGFSGDRTQHLLWRIEHGELDDIAPKQVILLIGINNLGGGDSIADTVAGIDAVCRRIHEKLPEATLLVLGVLPCQDLNRAAKVDKVNFLLETSIHPRSYADVLDLGNKFRKPDGTLNTTLFSDGLHPNAAGYAVLAAGLESAVSVVGLNSNDDK